jgi:outer membrane receptor protein involved in Fe transport
VTARQRIATPLTLAAIALTATGCASATKAATAPGPTVTVTQAAPAVTVTKTPRAVRVRVTVTPTANAQGEATQISQDGVYVVGQDIPGGTWHTSGGSQCYEATLGSTDTSNIIDNNNFTGPDTVSLAGAKAFDISGGCTWSHQ